MGLQYLDDGGYSGGVNRDDPSILLPRGDVYDAVNMLFDRPGIARMRNGNSALSALGSVASFATALGFATATGDSALLNELMAVDGKAGALERINQATGAHTSILSPMSVDTIYSRAVQHFGFLFFPGWGDAFTNTLRSVICAGQATAGAFANTVAVNTTAGSPTVTLTAPDTTTNIKVGGVIQLNAAAVNYSYFGRVIAIDSATQFRVWPTPTHTQSYATGAGSCQSVGGQNQVSARCAASFQNRLVLGGFVEYVGGIQNDRRLGYSPLPTEEILGTVAGAPYYTGAIFASPFMYRGYFGAYNFIDVPGTDPFVAMEAVSDNELLILSARRPVIFRGNLVTQLGTTTQQVTFDVSEVDKIAGCSSDLTVQRTPRGVMWAGPDGVFVYTGSDFVNVLTGKMLTYWRNLARSTTFGLHGSAYLRGHYMVAGTSGGTAFQLAVNLQSREYTFAPLTGVDIFHAVANPVSPAQVFALKWWDQTGAAPNVVNGQCIRLESMLDPYSAGATGLDSTGAAIPFSITSRVLAGDQETQKVFQRATVRYQAASTTAGVTVAAKTGIDSSDTAALSSTVATLSNTSVLVIASATGAGVSPIVCTTATHGLQTDDFVDISGAVGNTHVNGRWRITVLSSTTFALLGSTGNGAYTASSARVKKVTEQDFMLTAFLERGQGVIFTISAAAVQGFELHGLRVAYFDNDPVMSA